ncbi:MAG: right-handed parallel beta-helix repeat-containing protein [Pleurocapsa sp.]
MTVITVTNNADRGTGSLREAIYQANLGDTIKFDSSLSNQTISLNSGLWLGKNLTIDGEDAPGLTISGDEKTNILWLGKQGENLELSVKNLTLADSYYEENAGGAIWASENSIVNIDNVNFINNVSDGAALHGQAGTVITVTNSTFDNNDGAKISDKGYSTGAISLFAYGSLTIKNSVFTNNKGYGGGALHVTSSDLIVEDSIFVGNDSTPGADKDIVAVPGGGGAIYLDAASVPNDPRFYQGELERETEGGIVSIRNSRFENNRAAGQGGAIMAWGYNQDQVVISDSEIINNKVIQNKHGMAQGGGLWLMGFVEIDNTIIANNKSADLGGGLYVWGESPIAISNSNFSGNQAMNGAAIYDSLWASQLEIENTNFDSNSASDRGGVLDSIQLAPVSLNNSQFSNNTPDDLNDVSLSGNVPNIVYGTDSSETISGTDGDSYLIGLNSNDILEGKGGEDYLDGGADNDTLYGGLGNDTLIGGGQRNSLFGGDGDDIFIGGKDQDLIEGGNGKDRYIIGDENNIYYSDSTWYDHAIITDFELTEDTIQLRGEASDYTIKPANSQGIYGTGIFYENGLLAIVGGISPNDFSLDADYISYAPEFPIPVDSSALELKQDILFAGTPDYNPSEHDGLIVWNEGDTWHIEATGDLDGSRFTGKIIANSPIEDLAPYKLENGDRVEFTDLSHKIIEFDLRIWDKWIDGISFKVADGSSVFLDLENNHDVSIKAGLDLQEINLSQQPSQIV